MAPRSRRYWLMKSEPSTYSFEDLWAEKGRNTPWDGVRNYQARNFMRDDMRVGDGVLFYHSSTNPPGVAGVAEVASKAYPDPTQFDPADSHHDPKSSPDDPRWILVDVKGVARLPRFVGLAEIKECVALAGMGVVQRGSRLSIQPVTAREWKAVLAMGGL